MLKMTWTSLLHGNIQDRFDKANFKIHRYKLLLRADLDTFPTPKMLGFWTDMVICNRSSQIELYVFIEFLLY